MILLESYILKLIFVAKKFIYQHSLCDNIEQHTKLRNKLNLSFNRLFLRKKENPTKVI